MQYHSSWQCSRWGKRKVTQLVAATPLWDGSTQAACVAAMQRLPGSGQIKGSKKSGSPLSPHGMFVLSRQGCSRRGHIADVATHWHAAECRASQNSRMVCAQHNKGPQGGCAGPHPVSA